MSFLRLAFFGTPDFAIPSLERLLAGRHPVVAVVSQPDRGRGRGRRETPSPVSRLALERELPLLRPERVGEAESEAWLRERAPDLGVVVAFGQFIPRRIRELPRCGYLINGHASLLPKYRGAAPIARAILAGETRTGVSVMRLVREMDAGPVAAVRELEIGGDESAGELSQRLAALCAESIADVVERVARDDVTWTAQETGGATLAPKLTRADAELSFAEPAEALVRRVRALSPQPGAFLQREDETLRILAARADPGPVDGPPGTARRDADTPLRIATAEGWLVPLRVQQAGGRAMAVEDFLRGHPIPDGERLGREPATATLES